MNCTRIHLAAALALLGVAFSSNISAQQGAVLQVSSAEINFGVVRVGDSVSLSFGMQNVGDLAATGLKVYLWGEHFQVFDNCPAELAPGERCSVGVQFSPHRDGYFQRWVVASSDEHEVIVKLIGQAR